MMVHAGNTFNNKTRTNAFISSLFVWPHASASGKTNTTKRPQNMTAWKPIESDSWQQHLRERKSNSSSAAQYHKWNPLMMAGKQIAQFGFACASLELKSCLKPNCVHQPVWAFAAALFHNTPTDLLCKQTLVWIPTTGWLKPQIVFRLPNNVFTTVCVFVSLCVLCNPNAIMLFTDEMAIWKACRLFNLMLTG